MYVYLLYLWSILFLPAYCHHYYYLYNPRHFHYITNTIGLATLYTGLFPQVLKLPHVAGSGWHSREIAYSVSAGATTVCHCYRSMMQSLEEKGSKRVAASSRRHVRQVQANRSRTGMEPDYGSIQRAQSSQELLSPFTTTSSSSSSVSHSSASSSKFSKIWLFDTQIFTAILIYISYVRDQQAFNFLVRVFTQLILYSIPDTENLSDLRMLMSSEDLDLQITRITMVLVIVIPYTLMNFFFSMFLHMKWLYSSALLESSGLQISVDSIRNTINAITEKNLNSTTWINDGIFVDLIGESSMNCIQRTPINSSYLVFLDIAIMCLQLSTIQVLRQRIQRSLQHRQTPSSSLFGDPCPLGTVRINVVTWENV